MAEQDNKIKKNFLSGIVYQVVLIVLGFLLPRLYLENFGSEVNGVLSTIKQIFMYMTLLESGVGLAATGALHKPFKQEEHDKVSAILSATGNFYQKIGFVYSGIALLIATVYAFVVPTGVSPLVVFSIIVLTALPSVFSYFVQAKYRILLEVEGQNHIITNAETMLQLLSSVAKILVLVLTDSLVLIQLTYCLLALLQLFYITVRAKRRYPWLNVKAKPDNEALSDRKSVLVHQISGMVFNNTDVLLLSFLCDFKAVSIYTIYNIFFSQVQAFITTVVTSFKFKLWSMYKTQDEKFQKIFTVYETFYIMGTFIIYTLMAVFLLPLIQIYTQGINDADYTNIWLVFLFVLMNLLSNGKLPANHALEFAGQFEETKSHAIVEMCINLVVSVVAILYWGICGAIVGTIAALAYRGTMMIYHSNKYVLNRSIFSTYKLWLVNGAVFAVVMLIFFVDSFSGLSFAQLLVKGIVHSLWILPLYIAVNFVFSRDAFKLLFELRGKKHVHS